MATWRSTFLLALLTVVWPGTTKAGVYNFAEDRDRLNTDLMRFRDTLLPLREIGQMAPERRLNPEKEFSWRQTKVERPIIQRYLLMLYLHDRERWTRLPLEQQLNLSAYLLRWRLAAEAKDLLEPLAARHPDNFLVLANLATAWFYLDELGRARAYQERALAAWPKHFDEVDEKLKPFLEKVGWDEFDHLHYRGAEEYFYKLIQLRQAEKERGKEEAALDALFTGPDGKAVLYVSDTGEYDPPNLAAAQKSKLPKDSLEVVQQLLLWVPHDNRLYWQLGELAWVHGDIKAAKTILLQDLEKYTPLRDHQKVLRRVPNPPEKIDATIEDMEKKVDDLGQGPASAPYPFRDVALGFGVGIAVGLFGYWQFRELRRRRQRK